MKPTVEEFEKVVNRAGLDFHGEYFGRCYHEGIAVTAQCLGDIGRFLKELEKEDFTLGKWDHQANLGYDYIASWSVYRFRKEKEEGEG